MKLPNGFGSVYKLSGKRRKPWCARKTAGWTFNEEKQKSYPIYQFVGYYTTRKEALEALTEYNSDPYNLEAKTLTFEQLYAAWSEEYFKTATASSIDGYKKGYRICEDLYKMKIRDIKLNHIQKAFDDSGKNSPTLRKGKVVIGLMYNYAVAHELISADKREMLRHLDIDKAGNPNAIERAPFSKNEIKALWDNAYSVDYVPIVLVLIYTGLRIGELLDLKKEDVYLEKRYFDIKYAKTKSGIRSVPIAEKIVPFFKKWLATDSEYLVSSVQGKHIIYGNFNAHYWSSVMEKLKMNHRPHDTRHTCISLMAEKKIDERLIKKIVGHKGQGVTETVYTHFESL